MPVRPHCLALVLLAALPSPVLARDEPSPALKARIAKLALKQVEFGAVSLLPVTFAGSGLAGPFEEDGHTYFCVMTRMKGRDFGGSEHVRIAMRYENDRLTMMHDDDVCAYHHARPFPELTALGNAR
ncbi:hypothetical protein [Methylobacterium persicinum]|uniref:Uncharacterized protein n=1 Tax=Methylobacterium persicinum TaxID=374426 RepID=A0ABU0HS26_9HYPH|nr:hypothetical protein [Methylobacterium persicinum]MDQ0445133.1 hypothetical protein [Methylobacterium persicinum]GJE38702.1 hypothetical protein KHHGKMAE_2777 [Methylobacterium persicinum]